MSVQEGDVKIVGTGAAVKRRMVTSRDRTVRVTRQPHPRRVSLIRSVVRSRLHQRMRRAIEVFRLGTVRLAQGPARGAGEHFSRGHVIRQHVHDEVARPQVSLHLARAVERAGTTRLGTGGLAGRPRVVVPRVQRDSHGDLMQIAQAGVALGPLFGAHEDGHQDAAQDTDDANHDQQLDQRETQGSALHALFLPSWMRAPTIPPAAPHQLLGIDYVPQVERKREMEWPCGFPSARPLPYSPQRGRSQQTAGRRQPKIHPPS